MSIFQIEISDEARAQIEAEARRDGRDAGRWTGEFIEQALRWRSENEEKRRALAAHLLRHADEPPVEATAEWWDGILEQALAKADIKRKMETESS